MDQSPTVSENSDTSLPKILRHAGRFSDCRGPTHRANWLCAIGKSGHVADRDSASRVRQVFAIAAREPSLTSSTIGRAVFMHLRKLLRVQGNIPGYNSDPLPALPTRARHRIDQSATPHYGRIQGSAKTDLFESIFKNRIRKNQLQISPIKACAACS